MGDLLNKQAILFTTIANAKVEKGQKLMDMIICKVLIGCTRDYDQKCKKAHSGFAFYFQWNDYINR